MANTRKHQRGRKKVQKVQIVKAQRRRRRGPKITKLLKEKTTAKLRYVATLSLDAGSAAITNKAFAANGLHAPEVSGGHQPLLYDEYKLLYGHYRVISSKIKITPVESVTANVIPMLYGVYRDTDTTLTYSLGTSIIEDQRNKGSWGMGGVRDTGNRRLYSSKTASFKASRDLGKEGAVNQTAVANNPSGAMDTSFYQVWCASIAGNNPGSQDFIVQIDYVVQFTTPIVVTPS